MDNRSFLFVNKDASNYKSMSHLTAVNSYVRLRSQKTQTEHQKKLRSSMRVIYFPLREHEIPHQSEREAEEHSVPDCLGSKSEGHGAGSRLLHAADNTGRSATPRRQAVKALQSPLSPRTVEHRTHPALRSKSVSYRSPSSGHLGKRRSQSVNLPSIFHTDPTPLPVLSEHLDPFLRLATGLSHRDRNILQFYLHTCAASVYGTYSKANFCPLRDTGIPGISTNQLFLPWMLLSTEIALQGLRPTNNNVHILSRKAHIYHTMNKLVADPKTRYLDSTIVGLVVAGIAEARVGSLVEARKHLIAVCHLFESRGGLHTVQTVPLWSSIIILRALISIGAAGFTLRSLDRLEAANRKLRNTLESLQCWNRAIRNMCQNHHGNNSFDSVCHCRVADEPFSHSSSDDSSNFRRYQRSRAEAFGLSSPLRPFIESWFHDKSNAQMRGRLAVLYTINKTLWDMQYDLESSARFLDNLTTNIQSSQFPKDKEQSVISTSCDVRTVVIQTPKMKALAVVYVLADCAAKYGPARTPHSGGILQSWEAIEFVELLEFVSEQSRSKITRCLSSWLIEGLDNADALETLQDSDLDCISEEIVLNWLLNKSNI